ncbi:MAG: hypothetical protein IJX89_00710 [Alphaproteobacteria bacterium]|nr:hypothetical protein [Alphaproteobacteria bacterium]
MKKIFIYCAIGILTLEPGRGLAVTAYCSQVADTTLCPTSSTQMTGVNALDGTMPGCTILGLSKQCWSNGTDYATWYTCNSCEVGYTRTQTSATFRCGSSSSTMTYYYCKQDCNGCTDCTSDAYWSAGNTGYQKKVTRTCDCNTCYSSTSYRCAAGYYGSSTNGTSGCTICPSDNSMTGTSAAGSTSITSCYIVVGDQMEDSTGTYEYTSNCYYTN